MVDTIRFPFQASQPSNEIIIMTTGKMVEAQES